MRRQERPVCFVWQSKSSQRFFLAVMVLVFPGRGWHIRPGPVPWLVPNRIGERRRQELLQVYDGRGQKRRSRKQAANPKEADHVGAVEKRPGKLGPPRAGRLEGASA